VVGGLETIVTVECFNDLKAADDPGYGRKTAEAVIIDRIELKIVFHVDEKLGGAGICAIAGIGNDPFQIAAYNGFICNRTLVPEGICFWIIGNAKLDNIFGLNTEDAVIGLKT
jgi:hypothetical protein